MKQLDFVVYPGDCGWIAQGMQLNMVTHGESLSEVRTNIDRIFEAYGTLAPDAMNKLPVADPSVWAKYKNAIRNGRDLDEYLSKEVEVEEREPYILEMEPCPA